MRKFLSFLVYSLLLFGYLYGVSVSQLKSFNPLLWDKEPNHPILWKLAILYEIFVVVIFLVVFTNQPKKDKYDNLWKR
jgi:hypothetical protein